MSDEHPSPSPNRPRRSAPRRTSQQSRYLRSSEQPREHGSGTPPRRPPPRRSTVNRRELVALGGTLALGSAVVGGTWLATRDGDDQPEPESPAPTSTSIAIAPTPTTVATPEPTPAPTRPPQVDGELALVETSVADLGGYIARREVTAVALVGAAGDRVERHDTLFGAMIEWNPNAAEIAAQLDDETARGESRGPLHGVPVVLKDVFATGDGMRTTSGALALEGNTVVEDAAVVRRLREAGAIILGKTNMTEWSNVRANGQVSGWSDRGGQTRNPYDARMATWGSSSGSAAAVALSYAPIALGVETNGSIITPAAACGVVGLKPTVGLVSRVGVMPVSTTWDSPGPLARTVADVAAAMNVIAGFDPDDPAYGEFGWSSPASTVGGSPVHEYGEVDYTQALDTAALRGARLGICWQQWGIDPESDEVAWVVLEALQEAGAEIVEGVVIAPLVDDAMLAGSPEMVNAEFAAGTTDFFARYTPEGPMLSLLDVVDWNNAHAEEALVSAGQQGLAETVDAMPLDDPRYAEILSTITTNARTNGVDAAMDEYELDAFIAPTAPVPTAIDEGAPFLGGSSKPSAISGYPSITVPMGEVRGLPVGLHLFGRAFSEQRLIALAYSVEQLLQARVPPEV